MTSTKPNCFILGGQKCGSTWLANRLGQHPDVFMATREIHYFDKPYNCDKGTEWYETQFDKAADEKVIAEKTPEYLWAGGVGGEGEHSHNRNVHELIASYAPAAKFIVVLRDPLKRAASAINHFLNYGYFMPWTPTHSLIMGRKSHQAAGFGLLEKGNYFMQLSAYFRLFQRDQFLIFEFERDLIGSPESTMRKICDFLEIDTNHQFYDLDKPENVVRHSYPGMLAMSLNNTNQRIAYRLDRYFKPHVRKLTSNEASYLKDYYYESNECLFKLLGERYHWNNA